MEEKNLLQFEKERNKKMVIKAKKVHCPCCTNTRLLDLVSAQHAEVEIKCQKCGRTIHIIMEHNEIFASAV